MNLAEKKSIDRQELIRSIGSEFPGGKGVEVGTFKGEFSKEIMGLWNGTLYMVDVWSPLNPDEYIDASNHSNFERDYIYGEAIKNISGNEDRAIMVRAKSEIAANMFEDLSLDFVYIDANHAYDYVVQDIDLWYPKVKPGGYLCGHDYIDIDWTADPIFAKNGKDKYIYGNNSYLGEFGVNPAVDEFCIRNGYKPIVTSEWLGSWSIRKKTEDTEIEKKKNIGFLVMYDDLYEEMANITIDQNIKGYCELHGYKLIRHKIENIDNGRAPQWQKIIESLRLLQSNEFDWIFFLDLDCLIMNPSIKLESLIDEKYSFIIPSHGIDAVDFPMEKNEFGGNTVITSAFFVKNDEMGRDILKNIWDCTGSPEGTDINEFDHEQRQCRITFSRPCFKPYVKIIEERLLNRFWHMSSPFMVMHTNGINELTWRPRDFIVHVTGYPLQERIKLLADLKYFSGGAIAKFKYDGSTLYFSPIEDMPFANVLIKDKDENILAESKFGLLNHKLSYYIKIPDSRSSIIFEAYDESENLVAQKLID
jgi:hypothetical protein